MRQLVVCGLILLATMAYPQTISQSVAKGQHVATNDIQANGLFVTDPTFLDPAPDGLFSSGASGKVVEVGRSVAPDGSALLVVLRNNTDGPVRQVAISARVRDGDKVVALGTSASLLPFEIAPSGLGLMVVPFDHGKLKSDLIADAEVRVETSADSSFYGYETVDVIDLIVEADKTFVGFASRSGGGMSTTAEDVTVVCLNAADTRQPIRTWASFSLTEDIELDSSASAVIERTIEGCGDDIMAAALGTDGKY